MIATRLIPPLLTMAIRYGLMALAGTFAIAQTAQAQVIISTHVTRNMQCSGGVCTPTASKAWLNVYDLERMLAQENVTVETNAAAPDIVSNAFGWSSGFGLTLAAQGNLSVDHVITDSGAGPVNLTYNANGQGGMLSFGTKGRLTFVNTSDALSIDGQSFVLVPNIATLARLILDNPSGNFALAANYNARHDGTYTQSPIITPFQGTFEGLGNTITHLVVEDQNTNSQGDGFFYQTTQSAVLANIRVKSATIDGFYVAGGLVADNQGYLLLDSFAGNIQVASPFNNNECIGGALVGINDGTIALSNASGAVTDGSSCAYSVLGGLVGQNGFTNTTATIGTSYATGNVTSIVGGSWLGGLVGFSQGQIGSSSASGAATGGDQVGVGGLLGGNDGSISNTSATGAAAGGDFSDVGGLIGYNVNGGAMVDTCTAKGAASGGSSSQVGGALGYTDADYVSNCVSYGAVTSGGGSSLGGFIGYDGTADSGYLSNDSWDITTSGNSCAAGNSCSDDGVTGFY